MIAPVTRAITLWRPWSWAVFHAGKTHENRDWRPPQSLIGQRIWIHAGKTFDVEAAEDIAYEFGVVVPGDEAQPTGLVGTVVVAGFDTESASRWFSGPIGWALNDPRALPDVIPCRGAQGLWTVPPDVLAQVPASFWQDGGA